MQIECIISSLLEYYAEMQFILCKDSARRVERKELAQFYFPKRRLFYHELVSRIAYHKQLRSQEMFAGGVVYVVDVKNCRLLFYAVAVERAAIACGVLLMFGIRS